MNCNCPIFDIKTIAPLSYGDYFNIKIYDIFGNYIKILNNVNEEIFVPAPEKAKFAGKNHILIDDLEKNITAWEAAGGIGILHKNANDTINTLIDKYGFNER